MTVGKKVAISNNTRAAIGVCLFFFLLNQATGTRFHMQIGFALLLYGIITLMIGSLEYFFNKRDKKRPKEKKIIKKNINFDECYLCK